MQKTDKYYLCYLKPGHVDFGKISYSQFVTKLFSNVNSLQSVFEQSLSCQSLSCFKWRRKQKTLQVKLCVHILLYYHITAELFKINKMNKK